MRSRYGRPAGAGHARLDAELALGHHTEAVCNGAPTRTVMATTGHTSAAGLDPYIEDAELFTDPASAGPVRPTRPTSQPRTPGL